jgi:ABC-type glycerol-3-phosphate transport system permease component
MPRGSRNEECQLLTAGASVSIVIAPLVCLRPQRYFVRVLTAGAIEG